MDLYDPIKTRGHETTRPEVKAFAATSASTTRELPIIQQVAVVFIAIFSYVISYGLLLTFGMVALLGFGIGFATLPSASDVLFPNPSPAASIFATVTPTPRFGQASPAPALVSTPPVSGEGGSPWSAARTFLRIIVFGAAFLAIWPGWYGGYAAFSRLRRDAMG